MAKKNRLYEICPDTSPSFLEDPTIDYSLAGVESSFSNCAAYLGQYDCVNDLDFPPIGALAYLSSLPSSTGALSPSITGGSITAPLCDPTCFLTAAGTTVAVVPTQGPSAGGPSTGGSSSPAGTTSQPHAASPTPSSVANVISVSPGFLGFPLSMVWAVMFWIG